MMYTKHWALVDACTANKIPFSHLWGAFSNHLPNAQAKTIEHFWYLFAPWYDTYLFTMRGVVLVKCLRRGRLNMSTPARHHHLLVGEAAFFLVQLHEHIKPRKVNPQAGDLGELYATAAALAEDHWAEFVSQRTRYGLVLGVTPELNQVISASSAREAPATPYPVLRPPMIAPYAAPHAGGWEALGKFLEWHLVSRYTGETDARQLVALGQLITAAKVNAINAYSGANGLTLAGVLALLRGREGHATATSTRLYFERAFEVRLAIVRAAVFSQAELARLPVQVGNAVLRGGSHVSWSSDTPSHTP
ncbi:uncharacterized protein LOC62_06G008135 [Vanrija pseudolonga]|uniref:Uncharacterized protein n=1 Tax=Vanrija pseudolonga TaxID=143232 RepID=A0AAF0YHP7_9TREE|nr:hypothetical protein LOC62_06G008135 [Vanrija pseudolonga]